MNPIELRKERAAAYDAAKAITDKAKEEKRSLTDEELKEFDALVAQVEDFDRQLATHERSASIEKLPQLPTPEPETVKPETTESRARVTGSQITVHDRRQDEEYRSFGDQMADVIRAGKGHGVSPKLYGIMERATGLNVAVPAEGGFLIQETFIPTILDKIHETGILMSGAAGTRGPQEIRLGPNSNSVKIPAIDETSRVAGSRVGGIRAYRTAEAGSTTTSKPKFTDVELKLRKMAVIVYVTEELMEDTTALGSFVEMKVGEEFGFKIDDELINGDGASEFLGILNAACTVSVAKESGQAATTFVYENAVKMRARQWARSRANSLWLINQDVEPQFHTMAQTIGTGGVPVYLPPAGASGSPYSTLFGRPVVPIEQCATLGTVGDVILADMSQYLTISKGLQGASSIHVAFLTGEEVLRFTVRNDAQPWWKSALTPANGSNTLSPFVTLATRA